MPEKAAAPQPSAPIDMLRKLRSGLSSLTGTPALPPEMQQGIDIARKERPDMADVSGYGPVSRMFQGGAGNLGYTSPGGGIYLNQAQAGQSPQDWADTVLHEQAHVDQQKRRGGGALSELLGMFGSPAPYGQRPDEMEAFQVEKERRNRMGRSPSPVPSFSRPGEMYVPQDINLPLPKR